MNFRRFASWGKALIAVVAICAAASPAKADLTLSFQEGGLYQGFSVTNNQSGSINIGDFTGNYLVTTSNTSAGVVQTLTITNLHNSNGSTATFTANLQGTNYNTFSGGSANLLAFTNVTSSTGAAGSTVDEFSIENNTGVHDPVNITSGSPTGSASASTVLNSVSSNYVLQTYNTTNLTGGGTVSYSVTAAVVPEPSGIIAAMAGLPCVGALLGFARRRRVAAAIAA